MCALAVLMLAGCELVFPLDSSPRDAEPAEPDGPDRVDAARDAEPPRDAPSALVAHYTMDGIANNQAEDATGQHTAQCVLACPAPTDGVDGGALAFDGLRTQLRVFEAEAFNAPTFTIAMFVRVTELTEINNCLVSKPFGEADNSWLLCIRQDGGSFLFETRHDNGVSALPDLWVASSPPLGTAYHHVAVRWDGAEKALFFDGTLVDSREATGPVPFDDSTPLMIGAELDAGTDLLHFNGAIDELKIFGAALSDTEIQALAAP